MPESPQLTRSLPAKKNTLMLRSATPPYEDLVSLRRLGQTNIPTPTNTKPEFCHLLVPLPSDIFSHFRSAPTHYYLLRRLSDNFISATCLFRAVFPHANADEKIKEFRYLRGLWKAEWDERTGGVWVPGKQAMKLAEDYGVRRWIGGLLDARGVEAIPHEIIDLTLDDSDEEMEEADESDKEQKRRETETRESEEREQERSNEDQRKQREESEACEAERMLELERGIGARERRKEEGELSHGALMQMAVMR